VGFEEVVCYYVEERFKLELAPVHQIPQLGLIKFDGDIDILTVLTRLNVFSGCKEGSYSR